MLRVISGKYKRRFIEGPKGKDKTRPLPDRVRTAIFNMLKGHVEGESFFDAFAGTGSFGIEAISRGARECVFIERDREIVNLLKSNLQSLGIGDEAVVVQGDALGAAAVSRCPMPVHVIFFDPPYPMVEDPATRRRVFDQFERLIERLDEHGFAILRTPWPFVDHEEDAEGHRSRVAIDLSMKGAVGPETHEYGSTALHWYAKHAAEEYESEGLSSEPEQDEKEEA